MPHYAEMNMEKYIEKRLRHTTWFCNYDGEEISDEDVQDIYDEALDKYIKGEFRDDRDLRGYEE